MNKREFKDKVYAELARISKALGNPHRLEIIDLLAQGPFTVEQIAGHTGMTVANASQHLQNLKNARLVSIRREGNFIHYSLAGEKVYMALSHLRELGIIHNAEVRKVIQDFRKGYHGMQPINAGQLLKLIENNDVVLLDVRPEEEYRRGHIHRALSTPIDKLENMLKKIPKNKMIVAYCRGPFCVYADEAVAILQKRGYKALRLDEGFPDWASKGFPVEQTTTI